MRPLLFILLTLSLNGSEYSVPLFDNNSSKGLWQMVGVLGLKSIVEPVEEQSDPIIPNEDIGNIALGDINLSDESGISEDEVKIIDLFDRNLSNKIFDALDENLGELSMYSYDTASLGDKWPYFNSRSVEKNQFDTIKTGVGYWAKYQDYINTTEDFSSNAGFIFDNNFSMGISTYSGKVFSGWNLLSLPEKRTLEAIYLTLIDYSSGRDYNLSISKRDSLYKIDINLDNNSTLEAVKELNSKLTPLSIYGVQIERDNSDYIALFSKERFTTKDSSGILNYQIGNSELFNSTEIDSDMVYGLFLDLNSSFLDNFNELNISLNGESIDIANIDVRGLTSSNGAIESFRAFGSDKNLTLLLSQDIFYIENRNYIKRYEYNETSTPENFISIDNNRTIFQIVSSRDDINGSLSLVQNGSNYRVIKGYGSLVDVLENISLRDNIALFPTLLNSQNYIPLYKFPKGNSLKTFINSLIDGEVATQILSLKTEPNSEFEWDSIPISKNLSLWESFNSLYDPLFHIDKRRAYWVKFTPITAQTQFSIDSDQSRIQREVIHQVSKDMTSITNISHYTLQIFLKDISKMVRGYLKLGDIETELRPELDGTIFTAQLDYEDFGDKLESVSTLEAIIVDENGVEKRETLDINFSKPLKPSNIEIEDTLSDDSLRLYREDLSLFDEVSDLDGELCIDFGVVTLHIVRVDKSDKSIDENYLLMSDPLTKKYFSKYRSSSLLITNSTDSNSTPLKYSSSCEVETSAGDYEGVRIGSSIERIELFYKKATDFISTTLIFPRVMFIEVNGESIEIKFDQSYEGDSFYIVDSGGKIYSGEFVSEIYNDDQTPLTISEIEF